MAHHGVKTQKIVFASAAPIAGALYLLTPYGSPWSLYLYLLYQEPCTLLTPVTYHGVKIQKIAIASAAPIAGALCPLTPCGSPWSQDQEN